MSASKESSYYSSIIVPFYLVINSLGAIYRAYIVKDFPTIVFIFSVCFGYFVLDRCFAMYYSLAQNDASSTKKVLKGTICGLSSVILLGFAYQFSRLMGHEVVIFGVAVASSALIYYAYFIHDESKRFEFCKVGEELSEKCTSNLDNV